MDGTQPTPGSARHDVDVDAPWRRTAAAAGLLGDAGFFTWLEANHADIVTGGAAREHAVATSCRAKAAIVARDERETGDRALLNLGHTFGHALEAITEIGRASCRERV